MNKRLEEFIAYKTGGKKVDFANLMGWTPQYLNRLLKEGVIGIKPIVSLLDMFPELNARWLILGEGAMLNLGDGVKKHLLRLLELEQYIPVMTPDELRLIEDGFTDFSSEDIQLWEAKIKDKQTQMKARLDSAYKKQEELCKQNTVKKS